jgi:hypothetical protein
MQKIVRSAESWRYIPLADRPLPPEQQTVFRLSPMTQAERVSTHDEIVRTVIEPDGTQTVIRRMRQVTRALCLEHIEAVENFPVGQPQAWPANHTDRVAYLEQLPDEVIEEIGNEIYDRSSVGAPEKNSSPPGPTSA